MGEKTMILAPEGVATDIKNQLGPENSNIEISILEPGTELIVLMGTKITMVPEPKRNFVAVATLKHTLV